MSKRRKRYPSIMEIVGSPRPPNHLNVVLEPYPHTLPAVQRDCDYCGDSYTRRELTKLPTGLFICDQHPAGRKRDKLSG